MVQGRLPNGIAQFRNVYADQASRYGEEFDLNAGSTDNVYLIKPKNDPWVMIGAFDDNCFEEFFDLLKRPGPNRSTLANLGHIILQFFDGKQVAFIEAMILRRPIRCEPLTVHGTMPIILALQNNLSDAAKARCVLSPIKNKTRLQVEEGRVLKFVISPTLKLPEASVVFDPQTGTLFSGKFFSAHRTIPNTVKPFDNKGAAGWEEYAVDWYHFFDVYFFTRRAQAAIRKIFLLAEALTGPDVECLAPMHGPVVRENTWKLMAKYEAWTEQKMRKEGRRDREVLVMYASAYGNTKALATAIARGLSSAGVRVNEINLEHCPMSDVASSLASCDGFVIGSPTLGGEMPTQVKEALGVVLSSNSEEKLPCGVFGSFGWSGEAVNELQFRLKDGGFPSAFDPIRSKFTPTAEVLSQCEEAGVRMSQKLDSLLVQKRRGQARNVAGAKAASVNNMAMEAFGKMKSSQCVMSTQDKKGEAAIFPVSWVSQASFQPPGVTVAIPGSEFDRVLSTGLEEVVGTGDSALDREAAMALLQSMLGIQTHEGGEISPKQQEQLDEAYKTLEQDCGGEMSPDKILKSVSSGGLSSQVANIRRSSALDAATTDKLPFVLNMVPEGKQAGELVAKQVAHKKGKPSNGCFVHAEAHAFIECSVVHAVDTGDHVLLYAEVKGGKVFDDLARTSVTTFVDKLAKKSKKEKAPALAAFGDSPALGQSGNCFAGSTLATGMPSVRPHQRSASRMGLAAKGGEAEELSEIKMWTGLTPGKEYRLQTLKVDSVAADTSTIRSLDWDRDRFDIEFALERGTTYNAYVIKGSEKTALIDTSHEKFEGLFLDALQKEVDLAKVDYLIVSHTEPDHSGLIAKVLEEAAKVGNESLTVVGSKVCLQFLENLVFRDFQKQQVGNGDKIDLGGGHELEFVIAPNLHWPDTMFTFDHGTGVLYTCDAFGMHYCSKDLEDVEGVAELKPHYSLYYDCLMKPNSRSVITALKKTEGFEVKAVATGHGPMLTVSTAEWMEMYKTWSEKALEKVGPSAAIFWVSNFGQSERVAQVFAHGLTSTSVNVEMWDLNAVDAFELTEVLHRCEILVVCTPPTESKVAQKAIGNIVAGTSVKKHRFVVLDSCAEELQEPVALVAQRFLEQELAEALPPMQVKSKLTPQVLQGFEEAGLNLGRQLTQKEKAVAARGTDKDLAKALGRIGSSLYVVTAAKLGVRHAMVASWVTPASMSPLGISLTIAKDRAMEPLLRVGDSFTVNILEEGNPATLQLMKHFLQRFAPGVDRLDGVDQFAGPNGAAVLRGACAYLECKIITRLDGSDHWISYAEVVGGSVARPDAEAAVHHRKVGTYY